MHPNIYYVGRIPKITKYLRLRMDNLNSPQVVANRDATKYIHTTTLGGWTLFLKHATLPGLRRLISPRTDELS